MHSIRAGRHIIVPIILMLVGAMARANGQATARPSTSTEKTPDAGRYTLTIAGKNAGTSSYKFDSDGGSQASNVVTAGGQKQEFKVSVKMKAGKIAGFGADAGPTNHFTAAVEGDNAKVSVNDGAGESQRLSAGAAPFGNFSPHLFHYVLAKYDRTKGGTQTVSMMLIEGLPGGQIVTLTGKLSPKMNELMKVGDKVISATFWKLVIDAGGMEIAMSLHANADRHILVMEVPSQQYTAVRDGYEDLLKAAASGK